MARRIALALLLSLAACGSTAKDGTPSRYRAWCVTESKPVGPWRDTRDEAKADRKAHTTGGFYYHNVRINAAARKVDPD